MPTLDAFAVLTPERLETPLSSAGDNLEPPKPQPQPGLGSDQIITGSLEVARDVATKNPGVNTVYALILPFLHPIDLLRMTEISRRTREVACSDEIWIPVLKSMAIEDANMGAYKRFNSLGYRFTHLEQEGSLEIQAKDLLCAQNFLSDCCLDTSKIEAQQMALRIRALGAAAEGFESNNMDLLADAVAAFKVWDDSELLVDLFIDTLDFKVEGGVDSNTGILSSQLEKSLQALFDRLSYAYSRCKALPFEGVWESVQLRAVNVVAKALYEILEKSRSDGDSYWEAVPNLLNAIVRNLSQLRDIVPPNFILKDVAPGIVVPYLEAQIAQFRQSSTGKVDEWFRAVTAQEDAKEKRIWSNVPRKAEKKNFMNSFMNAFTTASAAESDPSVSEETIQTVLQSTQGPKTYFEAQTAVIASRLKQIDSLVSLEVTIEVLDDARRIFRRLKQMAVAVVDHQLIANVAQEVFTTTLDILCSQHIRAAFSKALNILKEYDPKQHGRLVVEDGDKNSAVEPLAIYAELVHVADIVQQMIHALFEKELVESGYVSRNDFAAPSVMAKRKFEHMLDDNFAEGLNRGIDILIEQVDFLLVTEQLGSDYNPTPGTPPQIGPTIAAKHVVSLVVLHLKMLQDSIERKLFDVFQEEVGLRLFASLGKHLKRQTISLDGAITVISDINYYYGFALTLKQRAIYPYYEALKQVAQLYLIDTQDAKQLGRAINDISRFNGLITSEELLEYVQSREDWPRIRAKVERVLYGFAECIIY